MKELALNGDNRMTVKEVAQALGISDETVRANGKQLYPELFVNGKTTYLNEGQVTAIKLQIEKHHNLQSTLEVIPKTDLEKEMLILQAMQFQAERINILQSKLIELQPKAESFDALMKTETDMSITAAAKHFSLHPKAELFPYLRDNGFLTSKDLPTQRSLDLDIMSLREVKCADNCTRSQTVIKAKQLDKFRKIIIQKLEVVK